MSKPGKPKDMDFEETGVEELPSARRRDTQKKLGTFTRKKTGLTQPHEERHGTKKVSRTSVGMRSVTKKVGDAAAKVQERKKTLKVELREKRDTHRQAVWDKLDAAKRAANEKQERLKSFSPEKEEEVDDDFDF